jgi:hypothetical protein
MYFIYCIYLISIKLFYTYAFHRDCVSSHIIDTCSLCIYRQTTLSNFICKGLRNATYRFLFIWHHYFWGLYILPRWPTCTEQVISLGDTSSLWSLPSYCLGWLCFEKCCNIVLLPWITRWILPMKGRNEMLCL